MVVRVTITVIDSNDRGSYVEWTGDPGWLSMPHEDHTAWFHCGAWAGEMINSVSYNHPCGSDPNHTIEIDSMAEVLDHLVKEHDFDDHRRSPNGHVA